MNTKSNKSGLSFQILGPNKVAVSDSSGQVLACESTIDIAFKAAKSRIDLAQDKDETVISAVKITSTGNDCTVTSNVEIVHRSDKMPPFAYDPTYDYGAYLRQTELRGGEDE